MPAPSPHSVMPPPGIKASAPLVDPFQRTVTYLRVSVTDRCDFRCFYCMPENITFLPRRDVLTLEELDRLCNAFIARGVRKVRITGGEPLVRRGVMDLIRSLGRHTISGALEELTLTTNASQLASHARALYDSGVRRINVSLDTLNPERFTAITRRGRLDTVLNGIEAARASGLAVKINTVALRGVNEDELPTLIEWAHGLGMDITLIETMPLGEVRHREDHYLPLNEVRHQLEQRWTLRPLAMRTGGPARYVEVSETGGQLGFITPLTHNFCEGCNRVRVTCTGRLYMCLGQDDEADLKTPLRADPSGRQLDAAITEAIARKPKGHDFVIERLKAREPASPSIQRPMSTTGG